MTPIDRHRRRRRQSKLEGVIFNALVLSSGLIPVCAAQTTRLVLQFRGGGRGDARRLNPEGGPLFSTAENWPPFVGSSVPFWIACSCLVAAVIWLSRRGGGNDRFPLDSPLIAYAAFLGGAWSVIFALPFRGLDAWPRDSAVAGAIQILCGIWAAVGIIRGRRLRKRLALDQARITESTAGQRWRREEPAGARGRSEDKS